MKAVVRAPLPSLSTVGTHEMSGTEDVKGAETEAST